MMTLNLPQVLLGKSWPQRWWVTPLGTMVVFVNQGILGIPRQNVERNHSDFFGILRIFFCNLLKKMLDHKTRFSFHFVLYPKDLGPSNGRV